MTFKSGNRIFAEGESQEIGSATITANSRGKGAEVRYPINNNNFTILPGHRYTFAKDGSLWLTDNPPKDTVVVHGI